MEKIAYDKIFLNNHSFAGFVKARLGLSDLGNHYDVSAFNFSTFPDGQLATIAIRYIFDPSTDPDRKHRIVLARKPRSKYFYPITVMLEAHSSKEEPTVYQKKIAMDTSCDEQGA
jgi:hypothetical protein